ncbi:hypothetical protein COO60DRAFT_1483205, partial [Scenedesmus sp. NREL 46B-D3]
MPGGNHNRRVLARAAALSCCLPAMHTKPCHDCQARRSPQDTATPKTGMRGVVTTRWRVVAASNSARHSAACQLRMALKPAETPCQQRVHHQAGRGPTQPCLPFNSGPMSCMHDWLHHAPPQRSAAA